MRDLFIAGKVYSDIAGPVGIYNLTGQAVGLGFLFLLKFVALLNINIGILNILPFPALDGGRLIFLLIEAFRGGKKITASIENIIQSIKKYVGNIKPKISLGEDLVQLELSVNQDNDIDPATHVTESLLLIENLLTEKKRQAIMVFDEVRYSYKHKRCMSKGEEIDSYLTVERILNIDLTTPRKSRARVQYSDDYVVVDKEFVKNAFRKLNDMIVYVKTINEQEKSIEDLRRKLFINKKPSLLLCSYIGIKNGKFVKTNERKS